MTSNITTHRFPFFGCQWHLEIDQDAQEIVQVECNGERFEAGINDYVVVPAKLSYGELNVVGIGAAKVVHILDALYDMAQEVGSE